MAEEHASPAPPSLVASTPNGVHAVGQSERQDRWSIDLGLVARQRDREAFERLFRHFAPKIKAFGLSTAAPKCPHAFGDELVQDVMLKIWLRADRFDARRASASTWIFALARNARIDLLRRQNRHGEHLDADSVWLEAEYGEPVVDLQRARAPREVSFGLSHLPAEQARALSKVCLEGKSHAKAADELSLPLGTVKSRVRVALAKLRVVFET